MLMDNEKDVDENHPTPTKNSYGALRLKKKLATQEFISSLLNLKVLVRLNQPEKTIINCRYQSPKLKNSKNHSRINNLFSRFLLLFFNK